MIKKDRTIGKILGVALTGTHRPQLLKRVYSSLERGKKLLVVTPNPENVLKATTDYSLRNVLNKADISLPDGVGLVAWHKFLTLPSPKDPVKRFLTLAVQGLGVSFSILFNREWLFDKIKPIKGREFALDLIKLADKSGYKVFLLGGEIGEAARARKKILSVYPKLKIESHPGPVLDIEALPTTKKEEAAQKLAIAKINKFQPDILLVGMTCPKQEKWLYRWLPKVNAKVGMTVGGTFRYLSGERSNPPKAVNDMGLEWLWRLVTGSQDIDRIGKAVWEFPLRVFMYKFNKK